MTAPEPTPSGMRAPTDAEESFWVQGQHRDGTWFDSWRFEPTHDLPRAREVCTTSRKRGRHCRIVRRVVTVVEEVVDA